MHIQKPSQRKKEKQSEYLKRIRSSTIYVGKDANDLKRWKLEKTSIINAAYFVISPDADIYPPDIRKPISLEFLNDLLNYVSSKDSLNILPGLSKNKVIIFAIKQPKGILNFVGILAEDGRLEKNDDRYFLSSASRLQPLVVHRSDKKYLMMRTAQPDINSKKKILVIGCGSIGGYLTYELAKTGFEDTTIVDDDYLFAENIFRHILGMEYVSSISVLLWKNISERTFQKFQ